MVIFIPLFGLSELHGCLCRELNRCWIYFQILLEDWTGYTHGRVSLLLTDELELNIS